MAQGLPGGLSTLAGRAWAGDEVMQAAPCTTTRVLPLGSATHRPSSRVRAPPRQSPLPADHMFRHTDAAALRKASAAELSLSSFTGGELFEALFGVWLSLKTNR